MAQLTNVNVAPILKEVDEKGWDSRMLVDAHPLLTSLERDTSAMSGDYFKVPIQYSKPTGRSHTSATAVTNRDPSKYAAFKVTPVSDYLNFALDGIVVRKAMQSSDRTAFVDALKQEVFSALKAAGDNIAKEAYGSGTGSRGQVHPTIAISTTSLTLASPAQAVFFAPGMVIAASATDGSALLNAGSTVLLASVNLATGVLVATTNWSTITGITNGNFLYQAGDINLAASGLDGWNPAADPSATLFFQVDRSVAPSFLGGMRYDGQANGDSMETVFISSDALTGLQSGNPFKDSEIYINPLSMGSLRIAKEGQRFIDTDNEYGIGVKKFRTPSGHVLIEDRDCPVGVARQIGKGCFFWLQNGNIPALAETDGVEMRYVESGDLYTAQVVGDHNFGAHPQGLCRIVLPNS